MKPPPIVPTDRPRLEAKVRLQHDAQSGKLALLSPENVLLLNDTGAAIVELCDGRTVDEVVTALAARFDAPVDRMQREVLGYLERLRARGLLRAASETVP